MYGTLIRQDYIAVDATTAKGIEMDIAVTGSNSFVFKFSSGQSTLTGIAGIYVRGNRNRAKIICCMD